MIGGGGGGCEGIGGGNGGRGGGGSGFAAHNECLAAKYCVIDVMSDRLSVRFHTTSSNTPNSLCACVPTQLMHIRAGPVKPPVADPRATPFTTASAMEVPCNATVEASALHINTQFVAGSLLASVAFQAPAADMLATSVDELLVTTARTTGATQFPACATPAIGLALADGVSGE